MAIRTTVAAVIGSAQPERQFGVVGANTRGRPAEGSGGRDQLLVTSLRGLFLLQFLRGLIERVDIAIPASHENKRYAFS